MSGSNDLQELLCATCTTFVCQSLQKQTHTLHPTTITWITFTRLPVLEPSGAGDKSKHEADEMPKPEKDHEIIKYYSVKR